MTLTKALQQHVEGRTATLRILEWVEAYVPSDDAVGAVWEMLTAGIDGDEIAAETDYAVTRWERLPWTEGTAVFAYLVPVLEALPIDVVDVRDEWARKYGGDPFAAAEFGS